MEEGLDGKPDLETLKEVKNEISECSYNASQGRQLERFKELNTEPTVIVNAKYYIVSNKWYQSWLTCLAKNEYNPGKIDNSDIIHSLNPHEYYVHRSPAYQYANILLKPDVRESIDFIICTEAAYKFIDRLFSHKPPEVIRFGIQLTENTTIVELNLMSLSVCVYPEITRRSNIDKTLIVSHQENIGTVTKMLKEFIGPYFESAIHDKNTARLWKMNKDLKLEKTLGNEILVPGTILDSKLTVESACIAENDLIILEHCKQNTKWVLQPHEKKFSQKNAKSGIIGLQNLGNTCFMNSALQCVVHSMFLKDYFLQNLYLRDLNLTNPMGSRNAELAKVFAVLIKEIWSTQGGHLSPWEFKKSISRLAPQFGGYQQHDSHELLSYLLSGLHEDLNRVKELEYQELPEIAAGSDDESAAKLHWNWFKKRNQSIIVDSMYGQCKSTLVCPDCQKVSITFDPVLSFGVVIPNSEIKKLLINVVQQDFCKPIIRIFSTVMEGWKVSKLKDLLFNYFNTHMQVAIFEKINYLGIVEDDANITELYFKNIYAYEDTGDSGVYIPIQISKAAEKGFFTGSDKKIISLPRLIKVSPSTKAFEIQDLINSKFGSLVSMNNNLQNIYTLNIVNSSKVTQGFFFSGKVACDFCKKKCSNCPLSSHQDKSLEELLEMRKNSEGPFQLEMEWNPQCKNINSLNHFVDELNMISESVTPSQSVSTLSECLERSCRTERLDENNKWYCSRCKNHVRALKTYQLYSAPKYFIVHLMRFKSKNYFNEKNNTFVEFPLEGLNLANVVLCNDKPHEYDLYAVSNHFGNIAGGHYTAFIKEENCWFEMDDHRVTQVLPEKVISNSAYVLFYKQKDN